MALGLPADAFVSASKRAARVLLWPDMFASWRLFLAMSTQWQTAGMAGVRTGLRYEVLPMVAGLLSPPVTLDSQTFADIRLMEGEALDAWAKRKGR